MPQPQPLNIVITGANTGLGREAVRRLLSAGHTVYLTARNAERGIQAAEELGAQFVQLDVTSDESVQRAADHVASRLGHVDVLVNNAAVPGPQAAVEDVDVEQFRWVYETNVFGVVRVVRAFLPLLRKSGAPSIVNIGSESGSFATVTEPDDPRFHANGLVYGSSKAALSMLTVQYAKLLDGIQVNAVAPGFTNTRFNQGTGTQTLAEGTDALLDLINRGTAAGTGNFYDRHGLVGW